MSPSATLTFILWITLFSDADGRLFGFMDIASTYHAHDGITILDLIIVTILILLDIISIVELVDVVAHLSRTYF